MTAMTGYVDYAEVMRAFAAECQKVFGPSRRHFTREWKDFNQYPDEQMRGGVACLVSGGIESYPYEQGSTECGRFAIKLTVFGVVTGPDGIGVRVEEAEFAAIHELERIARACQSVDSLGELKLLRIAQSQQQEAPFWWVGSEWRLFVEGDEDGG